jgi:hypothetical protein
LYVSNYSVSTDDLVQKKENNICAEATSKAAESKKTAGTPNRTTHSQPVLMSIFFSCPEKA